MRTWLHSVLGRSDPLRQTANRLCDHTVTAARRPNFYVEGLVEDDFQGRFDLLSLHGVLVMRRLRAAGPSGLALAERFAECLFDRVDYALREEGVGDATIARKVRGLGETHYGLARALDPAIEAGASAVEAALLRNGLGGAAPRRLARYVCLAAEALNQEPDADLFAGALTWPPLQGAKA